MPDRPDELNILVPESRRAAVQRMITRRQALLAGGGAAMAAYVASCGGSTAGDGGAAGGGGGEESADEKPPTPADGEVEQGTLLLANWVDYSDPANYKAYQKEYGPKIKVTGFGANEEILAKLRAGGSKFDVIAPTGYAVKTMADLGLIMPLTHELIPNLKNVPPAFTKTDYDPGNKYSVPKDYGITSFYWVTDKVSDQPKTIGDCFELLKDPKFKDMRVNFLEGGTQVMALALAALGTRSTPRTKARSRRPRTCSSRSSRTSTRSTRRTSSAPSAARSTSAWAGTATSAERSSRSPRRTAR